MSPTALLVVFAQNAHTHTHLQIRRVLRVKMLPPPPPPPRLIYDKPREADTQVIYGDREQRLLLLNRKSTRVLGLKLNTKIIFGEGNNGGPCCISETRSTMSTLAVHTENLITGLTRQLFAGSSINQYTLVCVCVFMWVRGGGRGAA